jgi:hypothetical protein
VSAITKDQFLQHAREFGPVEVLETACQLLSAVEVCELARELAEIEAEAAKKKTKPSWYPNASQHPAGHRALRRRMRRPPDAIIDEAIVELAAEGRSDREIRRLVGVRVERVKCVRNAGISQSGTDVERDAVCPTSSRMDTRIPRQKNEVANLCLECSAELPLIGRKVYCSDACRKAASRGGRRMTRAG